MRTIANSELILNDDGSVFHLRLRPEQLADTVVLVGDPARVEQVARHFSVREFSAQNREYHSVTGTYKGRRMTVLSHGIGCGNIDIVMTELDALANIDLASRKVREEKKQLTMLRLGTSGALQPDLEIGDMVFARTSCGMDGLLNFYAERNEVCDLAAERDFVSRTGWGSELARPYFVDADEGLFELFRDVVKEGITASAPGFYGPQGRSVRLAPADTELNRKIEDFRTADGRRITNFEMESAPVAGLARLMGHRAATICTIINQRTQGRATTDYRPFVDKMITISLDTLARV